MPRLPVAQLGPFLAQLGHHALLQAPSNPGRRDKHCTAWALRADRSSKRQHSCSSMLLQRLLDAASAQQPPAYHRPAQLQQHTAATTTSLSSSAGSLPSTATAYQHQRAASSTAYLHPRPTASRQQQRRRPRPEQVLDLHASSIQESPPLGDPDRSKYSICKQAASRKARPWAHSHQPAQPASRLPTVHSPQPATTPTDINLPSQPAADDLDNTPTAINLPTAIDDINQLITQPSTVYHLDNTPTAINLPSPQPSTTCPAHSRRRPAQPTAINLPSPTAVDDLDNTPTAINDLPSHSRRPPGQHPHSHQRPAQPTAVDDLDNTHKPCTAIYAIDLPCPQPSTT
ncbi:hypothetical protein COO60DRAFT_1463842 [Scenedesmus sp. NREL 46B-D3]|nr:hypothetical protein COO60DRAFT_1463842 [Scenedesmus sp. NREL 46B-D3]